MPRILVVDDDEEVGSLAEFCLSSAGFEVRRARDGAEGLRLSAEGAPDLVLLDLLMPGMHGYEACARLRAQRPEVKILIHTGKRFAADRRAVEKLGADGFLLKPWTKEELLAAVRGLLAA